MTILRPPSLLVSPLRCVFVEVYLSIAIPTRGKPGESRSSPPAFFNLNQPFAFKDLQLWCATVMKIVPILSATQKHGVR